jgi:HSP20 family protein
MAEETKAMEVQKEELPAEETERTRDCRCFIPRADIYETSDNIIVMVDMPGIHEDNIDITLEKNILTINGYTDPEPPAGYSLAYGEYEIGDYERSFRVSNQINRDGIEAAYKDGVLSLTLPKAEEAKSRKIAIKPG